MISDTWKGIPETLVIPLITLVFPGSDAEITGEQHEDALLRRMSSMCGR